MHVALAVLMPLAVPQVQVGVLDTLSSSHSRAADRSGNRFVLGSRNVLTEPLRIDVLERTPGTLDFARAASFEPVGIETHWRTWSIAIEGDLVAHTVEQGFGPDSNLFVHERVGVDWVTTTVPLPGVDVLRHGKLVAIEDDTIYAVATANLIRPIELVVVGRDDVNGWAIEQVVPTDVRTPWVDHATELEVEDGVAVIAHQLGLIETGQVAVCERDGAGIWRQTRRLDPPHPTDWINRAIALEGGTIAIVRHQRFGPGLVVLWLYERDATGAWVIVGREELDVVPSAEPEYRVVIEGDRVAVSDGESTRVLRRMLDGDLLEERAVRGMRRVHSFEGDRLIGQGPEPYDNVTPVARVVRLPAGSTDITVPWRVGAVTCAAPGTPELRVHDQTWTQAPRRTVAEVVGAAPGAAVWVLGSLSFGRSPAFGGTLCLDRASARLVAPPAAADAAGRAAFAVESEPYPLYDGFDLARHLQGVVFGPATTVTNSIATAR